MTRDEPRQSTFGMDRVAPTTTWGWHPPELQWPGLTVTKVGRRAVEASCVFCDWTGHTDAEGRDHYRTEHPPPAEPDWSAR